MNDFIEVREIASIILRRWRLVVLGVLLGAVLGFLYSRNERPVYEATATLLVGQSIQATNLDNSDIQVGEHLALTYAAIGRRQPVLEGVVDELGLDTSWQQLRKRVHINPVEGTQLLEISAESTSPAEARMIADEIANQMILLSPSSAPSPDEAESRLFLEERLDSLRLRIDNGQRRIEELQAEMASLEAAEDLRAHQAEIDSLEQMITGWESNYGQLLSLVDSDNSVNYLTLMEAAEVAPAPVRPRTELNVLLTSILGLALALGVIVVREYVDDSLKTTEDLEKVLGLIPLGAVSQIGGVDYNDKLISKQGPFSPTAEAFNIIRSNIRFVSEGKLPGVILVTSTTVGEGKSLTVANLGLAIAKAGYSTVIVDGDMRRPAQHNIFNVENETGLTELLSVPDPQLGTHLTGTFADSLWLITSGEGGPNASELLESEEMQLLLAQLIDEFDIVIVDGPPVLTTADAAIMSSIVDAVVIVVQSGRTRRQEARRAVTVLMQAGATVLGAVLNHAAPSSHEYRYLPYGVDDEHKGKRSTHKERRSRLNIRKGSFVKGNGQPEPISDAEV